MYKCEKRFYQSFLPNSCHKRSLWCCHILLKKLPVTLMWSYWSFKERHIAINKKESKDENNAGLFCLSMSRVWRSHGVKKGRQAAFSHWRGPHSSRVLHLQERQGQNEKWLVKGKVGSCVNMRKKMLTGASKWTPNRLKIECVSLEGKKKNRQ